MGSAVCLSMTANAISRATPALNSAMTAGLVHPMVWPR